MKSYYRLDYKNGVLRFKHSVFSKHNGQVEIHNYDFSKFIQEKFSLKNINVYAAGDYVAFDQGPDFLSKKLVYNKTNNNDVVALLANWYSKFLIKKQIVQLPSIITTVPRVIGRYDQLKQTREYLCEETPRFHEYQFLIKNEDLNIGDITSEQKLFSLDIEKFNCIEDFEKGIVVFDDVITTGSTLKQCIEVIQEGFNDTITWIALLAASSIRKEFSLWKE